MISIIAAVAKNRAIGYQNKTFLSLPKGALPNRRNIVLSRTTSAFPGCEVYPSIEEALKHCSAEEDIYIIGGASVYKQALPLANRLCLTEIDDTPAEADTFFPPYEEDWKEAMREDHETDEKHAYRYAFVDYIKNT